MNKVGRIAFAPYGQLMGKSYEAATDDIYRFTGKQYDQALAYIISGQVI